MSKNYKDISRRGLIALNQDFDRDNDDALKEYLNNSDGYENIRPVETVIEKADAINEAVGGVKGAIRHFVNKETNRLLDSVLDAVTNKK